MFIQVEIIWTIVMSENEMLKRVLWLIWPGGGNSRATAKGLELGIHNLSIVVNLQSHRWHGEWWYIFCCFYRDLNLQFHDISTGRGANEASAPPIWLRVHLAHIPACFYGVILCWCYRWNVCSTLGSHSGQSLSRGSLPQGPWSLLCNQSQAVGHT